MNERVTIFVEVGIVAAKLVVAARYIVHQQDAYPKAGRNAEVLCERGSIRKDNSFSKLEQVPMWRIERLQNQRKTEFGHRSLEIFVRTDGPTADGWYAGFFS